MRVTGCIWFCVITSDKMFYEIKARKAKYGFGCSLDGSNIIQAGAFVSRVFNNIGQSDETWFLNYNANMGRSEIKIYINDDDLYDRFKTEMDKIQ